MIPVLMTVGIVLLDQATKQLIRGRLELHEAIPVITGFFNIRLVTNTGAAWGMFQGAAFWLGIVSAAVLIALTIFRRALIGEGKLNGMVFSLLAGGIAGNLIDRIRLGYVVDFLDFHVGTRHFPAFNVADISICVGVALFMLSQFLMSRNKEPAR